MKSLRVLHRCQGPTQKFRPVFFGFPCYNTQRDTAPLGAESLGQINAHVLRETCELLNEKKKQQEGRENTGLGVIAFIFTTYAGGLEGGG